MSEKEHKEYLDKLRKGFDMAREKILKRKAQLDEDVVYGNPDGTIRVLSGKEAYAEYLAQKNSQI